MDRRHSANVLLSANGAGSGQELWPQSYTSMAFFLKSLRDHYSYTTAQRLKRTKSYQSDFKTKQLMNIHLGRIIQSKFPKEWKTYLILFYFKYSYSLKTKTKTPLHENSLCPYSVTRMSRESSHIGEAHQCKPWRAPSRCPNLLPCTPTSGTGDSGGAPGNFQWHYILSSREEKPNLSNGIFLF